MLNQDDSIVEEPPNVTGPKVDEHECIFSSQVEWTGQHEAHLQLVAHCDSGDEDSGEEECIVRYESDAPVAGRLWLVQFVPCER